MVPRIIQPNQANSDVRVMVEYERWPMWATLLRQLSKPEDKGIGDVVARLIGDENSEKFKSGYKSTFNKDCGCKGRQARWNRLYPLK